MASIANDPDGRKRVLFNDPQGKRRTLRLGKCSKRIAESVRIRIESLVAARLTGMSPDADTARWLGELPDATHERLAGFGLVSTRERSQAHTLGELVEAFEGTATVKESTMLAYRQTTASLIEHFGADRELSDLSAADAEGWRRAITDQGYATATIAKRTSAAKSVFRTAVRWEWLTRSPFADLRPGSQVNPDRAHYITLADTARPIEACPDTEWRAIVGLTRYAGLRCPSELGLLRWGDVDWDRGALTVRSPKTAGHEGHAVRQTPIVPELRAILADLFDLAEPGDELLLPRIGTGGPNLRTQLRRIISRAGLQDWPRLFQNFRASCATDWASRFPQADAARWLGHSPQIAARHYHQARDEHFRLASSQPVGGAESGANGAQMAAQRPTAPKRSKAQESSQAKRGCSLTQRAAHRCGSVQSGSVGDTGLEPVTSSMSTRRASQLRQSPGGRDARRVSVAASAGLSLLGCCLSDDDTPRLIRDNNAAGGFEGHRESDNALGTDRGVDRDDRLAGAVVGHVEYAAVNRRHLERRAA